MMVSVGKPKLITALIMTTIVISWALFLFFYSPIIYMKQFSIILFLISIFIILPGITYPHLIWKVDDKTLQYTYYKNHLNKIIAFFNQYLLHKSVDYNIKIKLSAIQYIKVTYVAMPRAFLWGVGYDVLFKVKTKDNSVYVFKALVFGYQRDNFNRAVEFIKSKGIYFVDEYDILEQLKVSPENICYYLEKIDKEKNK